MSSKPHDTSSHAADAAFGGDLAVSGGRVDPEAEAYARHELERASRDRRERAARRENKRTRLGI